MTYIEDKIPMSRNERIFLAASVCLCVVLMAAIYWMAFHAGFLRGQGEALLSGQADIRQGLDRIQAQNATAYAVSEDSKAKAVESARRMRELADSMKPNPFKGEK